MSDEFKPLESEQEVASQSGGNQVNPIDVIMDAVSDEAKETMSSKPLCSSGRSPIPALSLPLALFKSMKVFCRDPLAGL